MPVTRSQLIATLQQTLQADADVDAAWEGGSAAFDRDDDLSDVDAIAVAGDEAIDGVFERIEQALDELSPITLRLVMPESPGYAQRFYRLRDAGDFLIVDLVLLRASQPLQFREKELHGRGRTWFDRKGLLIESHLDPAADHAAARERIPALRAGFEMFQHLAVKERLRRHGSDALAFYNAWTLRPLVEALRLLHAPHTRVFGLRYLARDLPADVVRRVEALSFIRDLAHLAQAQDEAKLWFAECIDRLERLGPGAGTS